MDVFGNIKIVDTSFDNKYAIFLNIMSLIFFKEGNYGV